MNQGAGIDEGIIETGVAAGVIALGTDGLQDNTTNLVGGLLAQENGPTIKKIHETLQNIKQSSSIQKLSSEIINLQDKNGWTVLMLAVRDRDEKVVSLLVSHPELQPNLENNMGKDAVWLAASENIITMIQTHPNYKYRN